MRNIVSLGICLKKLHLIKFGAFALILHQNSRYFRCPVLRDEKLKKQTYRKTETCKLYSRVFRIFLPNVIKIYRYNIISSYTDSKLVRFFLRHSVYCKENRRSLRSYRTCSPLFFILLILPPKFSTLPHLNPTTGG